jgi:D-ribulokinase
MTTLNEPFILGVDLGTGGARGIVATIGGAVVATASASIAPAEAARAGRHEQAPDAWWAAVQRCLRELAAAVGGAGYQLAQLAGVSVDGTSGTIVALDPAGRPLRPAIMYNDPRATTEAESLTDRARPWCERVGYRFESSFALPKIQWIAEYEPLVFERSARFVHQADYIAGQLTGDFGVTDYSNALKTGFDLHENRWPDWIEQLPGVAERLPRVVAPGTPIGRVSRAAAAATGLPTGLTVVAGATDGVAAAIASGLRASGDYNTSLGTTLVFKGLSREFVRDRQGLVYSHKLPGGLWLPGAASNIGSAWIAAWFASGAVKDLDRAAAPFLPSPVAAYPLVGRGERFPFNCQDAACFAMPEPRDATERYAACLTGTALVERLAYDVLDGVCGTSRGDVYSTGGGSASDLWMQCRADVTRRILHRPQVAESAFGSAILAASGTVCKSLDEAVRAMAQIARSFVPSVRTENSSLELFDRFRDELLHRGYVPGLTKKASPG